MEILLYTVLLVSSICVAISAYALARIYHIGKRKFYQEYVIPGSYSYTEYRRLIKILWLMCAAFTGVCIGLLILKGTICLTT